MYIDDFLLKNSIRVLLNDTEAIIWNDVTLDSIINGMQCEINAVVARHIASVCAASTGNLDYARYLDKQDLHDIIKEALCQIKKQQ